MQLTTELQRYFSSPVPLLLNDEPSALKLEIKPYLQPFEAKLALRELHALVGENVSITERFGYYLVNGPVGEQFLRERLTFWQRVGRSELVPTIQTALEFTQNGLPAGALTGSLHNARRLRYGPHDIHEYRGKFFPQLVRGLLNISGISPGALVLDPMAGSGTTPCEAIAAGYSAIAVDLNPLSVLITRVKAGVVLEDALGFRKTTSAYLDRFANFSAISPAKVWGQRDLEYLQRWFAPEAISDLATVVSFLSSIRRPLYRDFLSVCLSNIIRGISWQKDVDLRVRKEVKPYEPGSASGRFTSEVNRQVDRIFPYLCALPKLDIQPSLHVYNGDSLRVHCLLEEFRNRVGAIVTSPPYATALPYLDTDRLSLVVLGLVPRGAERDVECRMVGTREISERERKAQWDDYQSRKHILPQKVTRLIDSIAKHNHEDGVGFRRRNLPSLLARYFLSMRDAMLSAREIMIRSANAFYVVGNNSTFVNGEKVEIPTDEFLFEIGDSVGWRQRELIPMELLVSRDIFKENRGSAETILCFTAD